MLFHEKETSVEFLLALNRLYNWRPYLDNVVLNCEFEFHKSILYHFTLRD